MARYMICYKLNGPVEEYNNQLTHDLSTKFGVRALHDLVPPHLTIKAGFNIEDITPVEAVVAEAAKETKPSTIIFDGFGRFGDAITFIKANYSEETKRSIEKLYAGLSQLGLEVGEQHNPTDNPHSSIARFLNQRQAIDIWSYVSTIPAPHFDCQLDNFTILHKPTNKWEVWKEYKIG